MELGTINVVEQGDGLVSLDLAGEWDISTVSELILVLEAHATAQRVRVDLTEVTFIDSTTMSALLKAQNRRRATGLSPIRLILPDDSPIDRIFEITGIARSFELVESPDESTATD